MELTWQHVHTLHYIVKEYRLTGSVDEESIEQLEGWLRGWKEDGTIIRLGDAVRRWQGTAEGQQFDTDEWLTGIPQGDPDKWKVKVPA